MEDVLGLDANAFSQTQNLSELIQLVKANSEAAILRVQL
jgi:hypothetical protein